MKRQIEFQSDFEAREFSSRRQCVSDAMGDQAIAVIAGSPATGAFDLFRQHNDFYYLCGVEVPHAYLLIDGRTQRSTLYLPPRDEKHERSEGAVLSCNDVAVGRELTGVDAIHPHEQLAADIADAQNIYIASCEPEGRQACQDTLRHARASIDRDPWDSREPPQVRFRKTLQSVAVDASFHDLSPILQALRLIKSPAEIALMRRAGELTGRAVTQAMRATCSDLHEYHLAAAADFVFLSQGAKGGGYRPIVACGPNINNPHYYRNNSPLIDAELVLMDYAPDCGNYTSDIGRMWPVNGRYSPWQRELYGFIVEYHKILLSLIRPHVTPQQIYAAAAEAARPLVDDAAWSRPAFQQAARDVLVYNKHLTHSVGMAVHDVGDYHDDPLRPGIVFALDPQMWVHDGEEQLYIRVEDTVVVTENGVENLTNSAPLELADVEEVMRQPGVYDETT